MTKRNTFAISTRLFTGDSLVAQDVASRVVFRQKSTINLPDEPGEGLELEIVAFVSGPEEHFRDFCAELGLEDQEWRFHQSESLVIATRTMPAP